MNTLKKTTGMVAAVLVAANLTGGCGTLTQARKVTPSGFLGDYAQLQKGEKGQANLVYVNPKADFKKYDKIMLEPICIYADKEAKVAKLPREDRQRLVNHLDAALRVHLKPDYTFVDQPGPGVMKLRVAITEAKGSPVALDTFSTIMPIGLAVSGIKQLATGAPSAVGKASAEAEATDSVTKERLFAAVDSQIGQKITGKGDKFEKWRTTEAAFELWSTRMQTRLKELRSK